MSEDFKWKWYDAKTDTFKYYLCFSCEARADCEYDNMFRGLPKNWAKKYRCKMQKAYIAKIKFYRECQKCINDYQDRLAMEGSTIE